MKNLIRILIFSLLINILLPVYPASAQNEPGKEPVWLSANPKSKPESPAQTEVENIDSHTLDVTIVFSGVWAQVQTGNGQSYTRLWHEDYSSYREPGQPALPGVTFNILIPQGAQVEVIQKKTSSHTVSLPRQGLPLKIIPAQRQASKSEPPPPGRPILLATPANLHTHRTGMRLTTPSRCAITPFCHFGSTRFVIALLLEKSSCWRKSSCA